MRTKTLPLIALALAAVPLGGCKMLFGSSDRVAANKALEQRAEPREMARTELAKGREALDKGNWAEAVMAFREARRVPEFAPAAHNGMGVAYAQLGRADLAERFFLLAIAEAPEDRRFSANLARLYAFNAKAQPEVTGLAQAPVAASPASLNQASAVRVERPQARLVRTAQGELRLQPAVQPRDESRMAAAPQDKAARAGLTFTRRPTRAQ
jgi:Flp pilus assembly protein TadD